MWDLIDSANFEVYYNFSITFKSFEKVLFYESSSVLSILRFYLFSITGHFYIITISIEMK